MRQISPFILFAAVTASSCADAAPPGPVIDCPALRDGALTLAGEGVSVIVSADPFRLRVMRGDRLMLESDAAAFAATTRTRETRPTLIEGFSHTDATDAPWRPNGALRAATCAGDAPRRASFELAAEGGVFVVNVAVDGADATVSVKGPAASNVAAARFASPAHERFVGLGEREASVEHRGRSYYCWVEEGGLGGGESVSPGPANPAPNGPSMSHAPVPFFLSSNGYGMWAETTYRSSFSFAADEPGILAVEAEEPELRLRVFAGEPATALSRFTALTGRPRLPAPWTFGPRRRADPGTMVRGMPEIEAFRAFGIPTTVVDDTTHVLPNGSHLGREADLRVWTDRLHRLGYKAMGYANPHVSVSGPKAAALLAEGRAADAFVRLEDGREFQTFIISAGGQTVVTYDMTRQEAVAKYRDALDILLGLGYDGWMLDFGEYLPVNARLANGMDGREAHNLFPVFMQRATIEHLRARKGNEFLIYARSGYVGSAAEISVLWSGDPSASFEPARGLPAHVRAGVSAGLSGFPFWGSDISGFTCLNDPPADKEVYLRWAQFGALSSDMHDDNACAGNRTQARKWSLWDDEETTRAYGTYAGLHTRLFPYLYAAAAEAVATGLPVTRHPSLAHPDAPAAWSVDQEFYFGPALYVAPVTQRGQRARSLWLPPGEWVDWWNGEAFVGDRMIVRDAPLDILPLFQKAGSIVAMLPPEVQTLAATDEPGIVDMTDRAGVLDARAALSANAANARAALVDGAILEAALGPGAIALPADVARAPDEAALDTCERCGRVDATPSGNRVRVSATGNVAAGALSLSSRRTPAVRVRWDVLIR